MTISKTKRLIIFGTGDLAQIAHEYFMNDTNYQVVAFTVDRDHLNDQQLCGLPVVPFDTLAAA